MKKAIIAQSGGPTSVINSSLAGAISSFIENDFDNIFLSINGIEGIINRNIKEVDKKRFVSNNIDKKLMARPSSILGSCRFKLPESFNDEIYEKIFDNLKKLDISSLIYIGGNDSMDTVMKLNSYMKNKSIKNINIIGCPKTIDNDLCEMDHSPGFGSAAKYINTTIQSLRADVDIYNLKSVTFVEIMGRNAGWLAASSLVSNYKKDKKFVNLLYLPEEKKSLDEIIDEIKKELESENNLIVAVAEGFMDTEDKLNKDMFSNTDDGFNHKIVAGVASRLADIVRNKLNIKSRAVELNIVQRSNILISKTDSKEAYELGSLAAKLSIESTNLIPVLNRQKGEDYDISYQAVNPEKIANKEKKIPQAWIKDEKNLEKEIIAYTLPLINGEVKQEYENGLPVFVNLKDFIMEKDL